MNLTEKLSREIARVTELRAEYKALDGKPGVNVKYAISIMDFALEAAHHAAGVDDAIGQIQALKQLEGFTG